MIWNEHSTFEGKHAFLSPSNPSWINYSDEKLAERYVNRYAQEIGTVAHAFAKDLISKKISLAKSDKKLLLTELLRNGIPRYSFDVDFMWPNFMNYVNDAIGFRMDPEVVLRYSDNCFGTADAIRYDKGLLRIHDYKSGITPAHIEQLMIYAALFCLEYKAPLNLDINKMAFELRLYQYEASVICNPDPQEVRKFTEIIVNSDSIINRCNV